MLRASKWIESNFLKKISCSLCLMGSLILTGCATSQHPSDPLEGMNRTVFKLNQTLDNAITKPAATAYKATLPQVVRTGVTNFFGNIGDAYSAVNNLLQGKVANSMVDMMRVAVNSIFGFAGIVDIATEMRLEKHYEDFGQTLGVWGIPPGPYLMLPILGPSDLRDAFGYAVEAYIDPITKIKKPRVKYGVIGLRALNSRANLLEATQMLDDAALDPYSFVRDAYLQRRLNQVYDGDPPDTPMPEQTQLDINFDANNTALHAANLRIMPISVPAPVVEKHPPTPQTVEAVILNKASLNPDATPVSTAPICQQNCAEKS